MYMTLSRRSTRRFLWQPSLLRPLFGIDPKCLTYSGRYGIAYGTSLPHMLVDAEEALFEIDEVLQEIGFAF